MSYYAEISRRNPTAFIFLIDQSESMGEYLDIYDENNGRPITKAQAVADTVNSMLEGLIGICRKESGVSDLLDISLIGYGKSDNKVYRAWEGKLKKRLWCPISQVKANPAEIVKYNVDVVIRGVNVSEEHIKDIWLIPKAEGNTPMKSALLKTKALLKNWIKDHYESYPPIVIHISDGNATDINTKHELIKAAQDIKSLKTEDGNVLLINCLFTQGKAKPLIFPSSKSELPDNGNVSTFFEMSSVFPSKYTNIIIEIFCKDAILYKKARCFAYNVQSISGIIKLLDIGTRAKSNNSW